MDEYYKNLARKAVSGAALFFNEESELLILKPEYKDYWVLPGGVSESYESPWQTCIREIKEETDLKVSEQKKLLSVSYSFSEEKQREYVQFIFYGGILNDEQIENIKLDKKEIVDYKFIKPEEITDYLSKTTSERTIKSIEALKENKIIFLD